MDIRSYKIESNYGLMVLRVPVLADNYFYLLHSARTGECALVDSPVAEPVLELLEGLEWRLTHIFNTHHHGDHVGANRKLVEATGCEVFGFGEDAARIPAITRKLVDNEEFEWGGEWVRVLFVPGHTLGHIAYYFSRQGLLFCGDTLFLMGCGRLFEGTPEQMFASLARLSALPEETLVCCAHEYTEMNGRFALSVDPDSPDLQARMGQVRALRAQDLPTVPATLATEKCTNPFLRAKNAAEFARLRALRNDFH